MARSTRKAQNCRKPNTICKYMLMQIFSNFFSIFLQVLCQSRVFQMWLSFATASTSAYKSSDWTQNIIQIHDDLPLWTTDLPTTTLLEFKVIFFFYKVPQRQNTFKINFECGEEKGKGQLSNTCSITQYRTERGYDCAIQSTMAIKIRWTVMDLVFF